MWLMFVSLGIVRRLVVVPRECQVVCIACCVDVGVTVQDPVRMVMMMVMQVVGALLAQM